MLILHLFLLDEVGRKKKCISVSGKWCSQKLHTYIKSLAENTLYHFRSQFLHSLLLFIVMCCKSRYILKRAKSLFSTLKACFTTVTKIFNFDLIWVYYKIKIHFPKCVTKFIFVIFNLRSEQGLSNDLYLHDYFHN